MSGTGQPALAFIGGGQMAEALLAGLAAAGRPLAAVLVVEPAPERRALLAQRFGVRTAPQADERLRDAGLLLWAVKPQALPQAMAAALPFLGDPLHVSIAAGVPLASLCAGLRSARVVRAMPNTSALVGAGVTGIAAADGVPDQDRQAVEALLAPTGFCFWVADDARLDAVTAVSGSGPAYIFHFLEAWQAAAESLGFTPALARNLVLRTAAGAVEQAGAGEPFAALRTRVTSKGGTTEAALAVLDARATPAALHAALQAAHARAGALSRELSHAPAHPG